MSNHLLLTDLDGCLPDFVQELDSLLSRQLNAMRSFKGTNIEKEHNLVEIHGEARHFEHAIHTLLNPLRACAGLHLCSCSGCQLSAVVRAQ